MIITESRSEDFVSTIDQYGWFETCAKYEDNTATSAYDITLWGNMYNMIFSSNQIIGIIDPETDDETSRRYLAQALGCRAFAYWNLAQLYQFTYVGHEKSPCVPLVTDKNSDEAAINGTPRATVEEVYGQITSDLDEAEKLLTGISDYRADNRYINLSVIYALRARAYLVMQKYDNAYNDAMAAINSSSARPFTVAEASVPSFSVLSDANWMWGIAIDVEDVHGLYTFSGFMGSLNYGYATAGMYKLINSKLFERISDKDVRKGWWINPADYSSVADNYSATFQGMTATQFLYYGLEAPVYSVVKFAPYQNELYQSTNASDIPLIRIEEMYYIAAEALAMGGKVSDGKIMLEKFVNDYRWLDSTAPYVCAGSTPEEVRDEIWFQRRVEFWGEGLAYFDMMRLEKGVDRKGANFQENIAFAIPAGSAVLLYQIPQKEIEGNPALSSKDQNPTGSASI